MQADIQSNDGVLMITGMDFPAGLALAGEIDESTYPVLVDALERYADPSQTLHLDLSGVQYCDVAGLRAMVRLASANGSATTKQLVLHEVPLQLHTTLQVLGWDALPGLSVNAVGPSS